jgi:hypothetical protein
LGQASEEKLTLEPDFWGESHYGEGSILYNTGQMDDKHTGTFSSGELKRTRISVKAP